MNRIVRNSKRLLSTSRTPKKDWAYTISPDDDPNELSSSGKKSHDLFTAIFDSALKKSAEQTAKKAENGTLSNVLNNMFSPVPVVSSKTHLKSPISLIDEMSVLKDQGPDFSYLKAVFEHIQSLDSNVEIINYFENTVLPNFDVSCKVWTSPTIEGPFAPATIGAVFHECLKALVALNDPMAVLALFAKAKEQNSQAAYNASIYNSIIALHWEYFRDFKEILDFTSEMSLNGVPGDSKTANLLSRITQEALAARRGTSAKESMPLWDSRDERRVSYLLDHRRCVVDLLSQKAGIPGGKYYS